MNARTAWQDASQKSVAMTEDVEEWTRKREQKIAEDVDRYQFSREIIAWTRARGIDALTDGDDGRAEELARIARKIDTLFQDPRPHLGMVAAGTDRG